MSKLLGRMLRRTPTFSVRLPRPRLLPRLVAFVTSFSVLLLLAASFAGHPVHPPSWLDPFGVVEWVVTRLRYVTAGVGALFGKQPETASAIGARIEFFLVAVLVVISLRWLRFWWLTVRPGPIEVLGLADAVVEPAMMIPAGIGPNQMPEANAVAPALGPYVTMMLRSKLSSVSVYLPTPTPGDAVGGGFLQTMRESTRETWWATTIEFISRIIPRSAYRVDGAVLCRSDAEESCGVAVRVTVLPRQRTVANTVWARTPEEAAVRAARVVAAAILPLTRRCLSSPWRHWHGRSLPVELVDEYEAASAYREQRRYDEALGHYRTALERDSLNPLIRLEMAQLQEQLGLYLDALATYSGALALWCGSPERYNSWLHRRRVDGTGRHRFTARHRFVRWRRYGNPFPLRFRYATALAYFEKLTPQWTKPDGNDPRSLERRRLRELLIKTLAERYGPVWRDDRGRPFLTRTPGRSRAAELNATLTELTKRSQRADETAAEARAELKRIFLLMSRYELRQLIRDRHTWLGLLDDSEITSRSMKLARDCWIDVRMLVAARGLDEPGAEPVRHGEDHAVVKLLAELRHKIDRATHYSRVWADHYHAACVYGQVLVLVGRDEGHREFARAAVKELFAGLESADSSHVSRQRSWILSEDADLRELRRCSEFQSFAAAIGPTGGPSVVRPLRTQIAELSEYQMVLLLECVHTMESWWQEQATRSERAAFETQNLVRVDERAWWMVHQLAIAHRNWPDRLDAIRYFHDRRFGARSWSVSLPDIGTLISPDADIPPDPGGEESAGTHAERLDIWADARIKRGNLCEILVALWVRREFQVDQVNKTFTYVAAAEGADGVDMAERAAKWGQLRELLRRGQAVKRLSTSTRPIRTAALDIIRTANSVLPERKNALDSAASDKVEWERQAWLWAEEQRVFHPNDEPRLSEETARALARAFAALAIAYEGVGDCDVALDEAERLLREVGPGRGATRRNDASAPEAVPGGLAISLTVVPTATSEEGAVE
jgi:tetratricopeptide (TPR) repeat protein